MAKVYKKEVSNGPFGRLIRTLGYLLVLIGAFLLAIDALEVLNLTFINSILTPASDFVTNNFSQTLLDFKYLYLIVGLLLLINTLSKNIGYKVILSLLVVITTININLTGAVYLLSLKDNIFTLNMDLTVVVDFLNKTLNANNIVILVINVLTPILIYGLIASKEPTRFATKLVSSALVLFAFIFVMEALPLLSDLQIYTTRTFNSIKNYTKAITYLLTTLGSLIGVLGIFRK